MSAGFSFQPLILSFLDKVSLCDLSDHELYNFVDQRGLELTAVCWTLPFRYVQHHTQHIFVIFGHISFCAIYLYWCTSSVVFLVLHPVVYCQCTEVR